jgi:aldehyde:ferredoxin oxidoreductase
MYGWAGKILRVDLSSEKISEELFSKKLGSKLIGGRGVNSRILYDEMPPEIDPLDPRAKIIIGVGPFVGTLVPAACRTEFAHKGPFTFAFCRSSVGGHFGPELKYAGYDHLVIQGRAGKPVYLWIDDGRVELRDASSIWGRDTIESDEMIRQEIGDPEVCIATVGPAGENMVRTACVMIDIWRAAGWAGTGAVFGSKNLKAIAVRGTKSIHVADPKRFEKACEKARQMMVDGPRTQLYKKYGRITNTEGLRVRGADGVENFRKPLMPEDGFENITSDKIVERIYIDKREGCFNCPVSCGHFFKVRTNGEETYAGKMEYAQVGDIKCLGIYDPEFLAKWSFEVNRLGLDTTGTQNVIAFAMECYEEGLINKKDTDGIELTFGNREASLEMLRKIAAREGFGNVLAEGTNLAAEKIKGSGKFAMTIKGARLHLDPRIGWGLMLAHATANRGADHLSGTPWLEFFDFAEIKSEKLGEEIFGHRKAIDPRTHVGKGFAVKWYQDWKAIVDSIGLCGGQEQSIALGYPGHEEVAEMLSALTGHEFSKENLTVIGDRIYTMERAYNVRCGLTRKDDTIPERFFDPKTETCKFGRIQTVEREKFEEMLDDYYNCRGWDVETGIPTKEKLKELGLAEVAEDMKEVTNASSNKKSRAHSA